MESSQEPQSTTVGIWNSDRIIDILLGSTAAESDCFEACIIGS